MTTRSRRRLTCLTLVLALALPGCARKKPPAPSADNPPENLPAFAPTKRPAHPAQVNENVNQTVGVVDPFMTKQLRIFVRESGRMPDSFSDFANARMDTVPRPPPGMKWVIDTTTLEVKLAKK